MSTSNFDIAGQFTAIKDAATSAVKEIFPIEGKLRVMRLDRVWVEDTLDPSDYASQKQAKIKEATWGSPVYAAISLIDKAGGKVIDKTDKVRLFTLPKITNRYSYIVGGNEYQVHSQLRLKPGVYTLRKQNGELKTQVNLAKGKNFDLVFNERTGVFYVQKVGGGQTNIPLYPILSHLGVSDIMISKQWGPALLAANKNADPKSVARLAAAFGVKDGELKAYLSKTEISPETTKMVLGQEFGRVDGPMLLATSGHLLSVHLGKSQPTDRDSLAFKELHSIEDYLKERIQKNKQTLAFKLKRSIDNVRRTKLTQLVNPGSFSSVIESFFTQDDKASTPEQTNPLEMLGGQYKVTIMGSGGIKSEHAVTPEMREIHPTHYGFLDPVATPESKRIGANLSLPIGAVKDGKDVKSVVTDKNGVVHKITPAEAWDKYIAFPEQKGETVKAQYRGKVLEIPRSKVDYYTPIPQSLFTWSTNLIPYLPSNQGNRAMMASKMLEQAIALKHREAPLVQVGVGKSEVLEQRIGRESAVVSKVNGVVKKITPDFILVRAEDGKDAKYNIYNNFVLNRKSFLHHDVKVKEGQKVKIGDLLADSNYTKDGTLALGTNMRAAYISYKGLNFEDGVVITESAAKKLTSEHIHKKAIDLADNIVTGLNAFTSFYPNAISGSNSRKLDKDGVIKKGETVKQGEILVTALQKRVASPTVATISRVLSERPKDVSLYWTMEDDGVIHDVQKSGGKIIIFIKTNEQAKIGDKLSGRFGNKGIITKIIPDNEAPRTKDNKPVEILLNPHGVISRINIGQIYESAAGKAALKTGKPKVVNNFSGENYLETTQKFLKDSGVTDKEELIDPVTGKSLGNVHVGNPYILKLFKQGTVNFSVRQGGPGQPYDANMQPLKAGGEEAAKAMDLLTVYSMLSHGARANLREMSSIKSDQNDEFWKALKSGQQLPPPKTPFVYEKFLSYLKGAGINVNKDGSKLVLAPLTDKQVKEMSSGEVDRAVFYRNKDMAPMKGGFFDPVTTGGFKGQRWTHLELKEPVVNPVFEGAARKLTGLGKKFDELLSGQAHMDKDGKINTEGKGVTGGLAIEKALKAIDVEKEIQTLEKKIVKASGAQLDDMNKRLRYLTALRDNKMSPAEAYMRKSVPILPPVYRPIYPLPDGNVMPSSVNFLYQNTGVLNEMMKLPVMDLLPEDEKAEIRKDLYSHVKGISGLTDLNIKGKPREGFISEIKGGSGGQPKEGFFISKMLSKKQDFVGRGTIIPEPDLGVDEVALPEEMAWKLFEPFIVRELRRHGKTPLAAKEEIKKKTSLAKKALDIVMKERHVLLNRAPSLHKFSIMAFKPKITDGRAIKIPPLVTKAYNADFDGDTMVAHVPITEEANQEAARMVPSRNLFQPGTGKIMYAPTQEAQIGLFYLSKTAAGKAVINKIVGKKYEISTVLDKKQTQILLQRIAKEVPAQEYARIVTDLKAAGEKEAYVRGVTLGLDDLKVMGRERDLIMGAVSKDLLKATDPAKLKALNEKAIKLVDNLLEKNLAGRDNPLFDMVRSGARGDPSQLRQILFSPIFVSDARGRIVPSAIKKSYSEGLDVSDYWTSMYGARRGMMDRAIQTSIPGAFSKDVMASTIDNVISGVDCGTKDGVQVKVGDPDALDRYLAGDQAGIPHNSLVNNEVVNSFTKKGIQVIKVRSPLTCDQSRGTCSKCYGLDEHGELPELGSNIGAKAGQTISEPLTQLVMNTFHTGGVAGTGADVGGYQRISQLLQLPKIVPGTAALSPISGTVTKVESALAGGTNLFVGPEKVFVPAGRNLKVKKGDRVEAGDPLSDGVIKPQDLVKYKGMRKAQEYIVDELQRTYKDQGAGIQKRIFETVVRSLGNTTRVVNNPRHSDYLPGDIAPYTAVVAYNKNLKRSVQVDEAEGHRLGEAVSGLTAGHVLTDKDVAKLKASGIKEVVVALEAIQHTPTLKGISSLPLLRKDWMAALGYRYLAKSLVEGAAQGWKTDVSDYHPVPALVHGSTFGKGKDGRY